MFYQKESTEASFRLIKTDSADNENTDMKDYTVMSAVSDYENNPIINCSRRVAGNMKKDQGQKRQFPSHPI